MVTVNLMGFTWLRHMKNHPFTSWQPPSISSIRSNDPMIHLKKVANQTSSSAARLRLCLPRLLHVGHGLCQLHIRLLLALQGTIRQGADGALPGTNSLPME